MNTRLRVVVDDRPLRKALTGVGNYIAQLLLRLPQYASDIDARPFHLTHLRRRDWLAELNAPSETSASERTKDVSGLRVPWFVRRTMQAGYDAAFRWLTRGYELYHEPNHVPIRCRLPTVTTIHDLSVLVHPEWHPADRVKWYEASFAAGVKQTRHFLAASEFTKREMVRVLGVPGENITVTYQAARDPFIAAGRSRTGGKEPAALPGVPERFFLFVGTLEPRKNVEGLLDAYAALPGEVRQRHALVIAGAWGWKAERIREQLESRHLAGQVWLIGYLHDPALAMLYARCTALVWPTWYEGFGLPPLEALACGARVIVSNVASLPEVVADAGVLLDPLDVGAWTTAMRAAAEDEAGRGTVRDRAIAQADRFTWKEFISSTVAGYRAALRA